MQLETRPREIETTERNFGSKKIMRVQKKAFVITSLH